MNLNPASNLHEQEVKFPISHHLPRIIMSQDSTSDKQKLADLLIIHFAFNEIKILCYELQIDPEIIGGDEKITFSWNLINYFDRRGELELLKSRIKKLRPNISFDDSDESLTEKISQPHSGISLTTLAITAVFVVLAMLALNWMTGNNRKSVEPQDAISYYYQLLDKQDYNYAWNMLSKGYQTSKYPEGLSKYTESWGKYKQIQVLKLETLNQTKSDASVKVNLALTRIDNSILNQIITYVVRRSDINSDWSIEISSP